MLPEMKMSGSREHIKKRGDLISKKDEKHDAQLGTNQTNLAYWYHLGHSQREDKSKEITEEGKRNRRY